MPNRRHPKQRVQPKTGKNPRVAVDPACFIKMKPVWRIGRIDMDGCWGYAGIDRPTLMGDIFPKLKHYESMTWGEITRDPKYNHSVDVWKLIKPARERLGVLGIDEESLFRFRLKGKQRVWGIRDRNIFHILWWDPLHEICPSHKKHT